MIDINQLVTQWNTEFVYLVPFLKSTLESGLAYDMLKETFERIPVVNRKTPAKNIAVPCLEGIVLNTDDEILQNCFVAILEKAMDNREIDSQHPAFPKILSQLSVNEILCLYHMSVDKIERKTNYKRSKGVQQQVRANTHSEFEYNYNTNLLDDDNFDFIVSHLHSLGIIQTDQSNSNQMLIMFEVKLNSVGEQFLKACLNKRSEELIKKIS